MVVLIILSFEMIVQITTRSKLLQNEEEFFGFEYIKDVHKKWTVWQVAKHLSIILTIIKTVSCRIIICSVCVYHLSERVCVYVVPMMCEFCIYIHGARPQ